MLGRTADGARTCAGGEEAGAPDFYKYLVDLTVPISIVDGSAIFDSPVWVAYWNAFSKTGMNLRVVSQQCRNTHWLSYKSYLESFRGPRLLDTKLLCVQPYNCGFEGLCIINALDHSVDTRNYLGGLPGLGLALPSRRIDEHSIAVIIGR